MPSGHPSRRRRNLPSLVPPALLLFLVQTAACGGGAANPVAAIGDDFPDRAPSLLRAGDGFSVAGGRFVPAAHHKGGWADRLSFELPADGAEPMLLHGQKGFEARVYEVGAAGPARAVEHAVAYAREEGAAVWTTTAHGVEEWIHVPVPSGGRGAADVPTAVWRIQGATVQQRGGRIELAGADGAVRAEVKAPAAFTASGRKLPVRLAPGGPAEDGSPTVELYVDGGGEAVLVDPEWQGVAPMNTQRWEHAAAHLTSDVVLVTGGSDGFSTAIDSAELYDPAQDQWVYTGQPMNDARICHTATPLGDGTAIAVGGLDQFVNILSDAEDYDPVNDVWNPIPSMEWARLNHAATLLGDGRVLITGGIGFSQGVPEEQPGAHARSHHGSKTLLTPGGAHAIPAITGGSGGSGGPSVTCWNFNPGGGSGSGGPGTLSAVEIWDPFANGGQWEEASFMDWERERHTATLLSDGTVLAAGGEEFGSPEASGEVYDPVQDSWTEVSNFMSTGRADFTATLLNDTTVLLAGGNDGEGPTANVDLYVPGMGGAGGSGGSGGSGNVGTFMSAPPLNVARMQHVASILPNGQVLVAGGTDGFQSLDSAEVYDPVAQTWTLVPSMQWAATAPSVTTLQSGYVLVAGGGDPSQQPEELSDAEIYLWAYPLGYGCGDPTDCQSGFCANGFCCNTACADPCFTCGTAFAADHPHKITSTGTCAAGDTSDGCCSPSPADQPDPQGICATTDMSTCGTDGLCDGNGNCAFYPPTTQCTLASCMLNTFLAADFCDGNGTCLFSGSTVCDPGLCSVATGVAACGYACATDNDCAVDGFCDPGGTGCLPKQTNGQPGTGVDQCTSGFIADGVCCDTACTGTCVACTAAAKGSGADGVCGPVQLGTNPHADCTDQGGASCGTNGTCDGNGACAFYPSGTVCGAGACQGDTVVEPSLCDGGGACVAGATTSCAPAPCVAGTCASVCTTDNDCLATGYCAMTGTCAPRQTNGSPATGNDQCLSGFFADGVCCDSACAGVCVACSAAKKGAGIDGVCGPVHVGTDPDGECANQGAASCGTDGSCDGNGKCALYPSTTLCSPASCQGNTLVQPSQCDGNGTCVAAANVSCAPGFCGGGICQLVCAVDADCKVVTAYCGNGTCQPKKPQGQPAGGSNECLTGFVADGVCCDTTCAGGACDACSVAAGATADGTCTPLTGACDDGNPCTINDMCQGGVCVGAAAMDCPPPDACHATGVCNEVGGCSYASLPNGTSCDDNNPCASATCQEGLCTPVNKLDGAPCTGGVCIAGTCVLDPTVATTSSSGTTGTGGGATTGTGGTGTTTSSTSTGTTGGGGSGGGAVQKVTPNLTGGGCAVTPAEAPSSGAAAAFFSALFVAIGRLAGRRRRA